jgi:hypothetical protein
MIAAIFVETNGCYFNMPGVDPWDVLRDARLYDGAHPVVAHPPCERWGKFATGSPMKKGYVAGDDGGCFESALASLRRCGGVLEHPAHSKAWAIHGIPKPNSKGGWLQVSENEWTCHVEQGHYGHKARKATWLLYVGPKPPELIWGSSGQRLPPESKSRTSYEKARRCGVIANMCSKHRQRTPIPFRDLLLSLAMLSNNPLPKEQE